MKHFLLFILLFLFNFSFSNESKKDKKSNSNNISLTNENTEQTNNFTSASSVNSALSFDGIDDLVSFGNFSNPPSATSYPFTMTAWYNTTATGDQFIVYKGRSSSNFLGHTIRMNSGIVRLEAVLGSGNANTKDILDSETTNDGEWHHVVAVFESPTSRSLYVDGILKGTDNETADVFSNILPVRFSVGARDDATPNGFFSGEIDEVRIYESALSQDQVLNVMKGLSCSNYNESLYYDFNDITLPAVEDEFGAQDGTITGATIVSSPLAIETDTSPDTDTDGVSNLCDLDDDNDGILDSDEQNLPNVALSGTANQSTTLFGAEASRAIDGNTDGNFFNDSVTHTSNVFSTEYWEVDLGDNYNISEIIFYNRTDCCSDRISNVFVFVADTPFPSNLIDLAGAQANADFTFQFADGESAASINIPVGESGRYVRLQKSGNNTDNRLSIAELEVIGVLDTDQDGLANALDLDSDDDGCSDANEYYESSDADGNDDDEYGDSSSLSVDANGLVIGASYNGTVTGLANITDSSISIACIVPQELLIVDLSVPDEITITATNNSSSSTISGSDLTGFYFEDFFANTSFIDFISNFTSGSLTSAQNTSDGTPEIFRNTFDPGLNIFNYTNISTSDFVAGLQAFSGQATWSVSTDEYNAMLTAPNSGNIYAFADTFDDLPNASVLGTYSVVNTSSATLDFQKVFSSGGVAFGAVELADVDGDNNQDLFISGARLNSNGSLNNEIARIYFNDGVGNFIFNNAIGFKDFEGRSYSAAAFEDLNNDSTLDLLMAGEGFSTGIKSRKSYANDGLGDFTELSGIPFPDFMEKVDFKFADMDGDSDKDVVFIGENDFGIPLSFVFRNDSGAFYTDLTGVSNSLPTVLSGSIDLADVDNDDDIDIIISGRLQGGTKIAELYLNQGGFLFTLDTNSAFMGVDEGDSRFADLDNDGDQDLVISGKNMSDMNTFKVYLNDGTGLFSELTNIITLDADVLVQAFDCADIDGDGDIDIFLTGLDTSNNKSIAQIWENLLVSNPIRSSENSTVLFDDNDNLTSNDKFGVDFKLYPNPTRDRIFNILTPGFDGKATISISNVVGRELIRHEVNVTREQTQVNAKTLRKGVYIVRLTQGANSFSAHLMVE